MGEVKTIIQCSKKDKIIDICKKYASSINKNLEDLLFLYEENKVNFELSFNSLINSINGVNKEI